MDALLNEFDKAENVVEGDTIVFLDLIRAQDVTSIKYGATSPCKPLQAPFKNWDMHTLDTFWQTISGPRRTSSAEMDGAPSSTPF